MLLETFFTDTLQGIPGDEDGGGMSASMMGFYPVTPTIPVYDIASPVFQKVTIHLHSDKDFVIVAHNSSRQYKYVQKVLLNGRRSIRSGFATQTSSTEACWNSQWETRQIRNSAQSQSFFRLMH
jgi:putative alpha-1,2-mannosidase